MIAITAVVVGIAGNALMNPPYLKVFLEYFFPALLVVVVMLERIAILSICLFLMRATIASLIRPMHWLGDLIRSKINEINSLHVVFFTRGDHIANLNNAMLYVRQNEHTNRVKVVTVVQDKKDVLDRLREDVNFLDELYPDIHIEFLVVEGTFGPKLIEGLSRSWKIPKNFMFIGSPGDHFMYGLAELGGVRLIV